MSFSSATATEIWNLALKKLNDPIIGSTLNCLLQSWEDEKDTQEQEETWVFLSQALDQDRLSNRPLFP